ncbi:MAG: hypothetical protein FWD37_03225, partial [Methanomassiliicoccaceae archaeon]|nr:hypothetical protein [Methanomassiliicoccaceae archaeon]
VDWNIPAPMNAGTYWIRAILLESASGNYNVLITDPKQYTILPKTITEDMFSPIAGTFVYDGSKHTPGVAISGTEPGVTFSLSYPVGNINAGSASVTVTGSGNYGGTVDLTFVINKAAPLFIPAGLTAVYGELLESVILSVEGWEWDWTLYDIDTETVGDAGSNQMWAVFTPDDDNFETALMLIDITVSRKPVLRPEAVAGLQWTGAKQTGVLYDISVAYNVSGTIDATAAGNYMAVFTLTSNYMWQGGSIDPLIVEWKISPNTRNLDIGNPFSSDWPWLLIGLLIGIVSGCIVWNLWHMGREGE